MATVIAGHLGTAAVTTGSMATIVVNVTKWNMSLVNDMYDAGIFGAVTDTMPLYRGMYKATGSIEGWYEAALSGSAGVPIAYFAVGTAASTVLLTATTGRTYTFDAHLDFSFSEQREGGLVAYTATFESTSNVTIA